MTSLNQPSFYSITPATVRYCKKLEMGARLLYGEITALCNKEGYCWATNGYFADLYEVSIRTINRWIQSLKKEGFVIVESVSGKSGRVIRLKESLPMTQTCLKKSLPMTEMSGGEDKNVTHNNTSITTGLLVCFRKKNSYGKTEVITINRDQLCKNLSEMNYTESEIEESIESALMQKEKNSRLYISDITSYVKGIIENKRKETTNVKNRKRTSKSSSFQGNLPKHYKSSIHWEPEGGDSGRSSGDC